ncbi:DUF1684 domain-containing protein [Hymenobacter persicinus]|uniref:DUF1684 domain-containing protein n=1 Tax=Hymenobacter persicinus TaxID=2025506 RepID=A0A4Q5LDQ6_9BACT|nr:DUF1684 domain-containing protein [Hymenobacter persicinus]RYU81527.1 DUF1684 domain-containing protein [Hymenobacter persicinus]
MRIHPKLLLALGLLVVVGYFLQDLVLGSSQYAAGISKVRREKDDSFRRAKNSPLTAEQRDQFDSLRYFLPDKDYVVDATLERFDKGETVQIPLTDGKTESYLRWGRVNFELNKAPQQLLVLLKLDDKDGKLFIPFTDKTNGFTTYGGGRYLDVAAPLNGEKEVTLDFNQAYNPYCAYGAGFACPVPPAENRLSVEVRAGEQSFPETDHTGHQH